MSSILARACFVQPLFSVIWVIRRQNFSAKSSFFSRAIHQVSNLCLQSVSLICLAHRMESTMVLIGEEMIVIKIATQNAGEIFNKTQQGIIDSVQAIIGANADEDTETLDAKSTKSLIVMLETLRASLVDAETVQAAMVEKHAMPPGNTGKDHSQNILTDFSMDFQSLEATSLLCAYPFQSPRNRPLVATVPASIHCSNFVRLK